MQFLVFLHWLCPKRLGEEKAGRSIWVIDFGFRRGFTAQMLLPYEIVVMFLRLLWVVATIGRSTFFGEFASYNDASRFGVEIDRDSDRIGKMLWTDDRCLSFGSDRQNR